MSRVLSPVNMLDQSTLCGRKRNSTTCGERLQVLAANALMIELHMSGVKQTSFQQWGIGSRGLIQSPFQLP